MERKEAIERIRKGLRARSGKAWSVKGGSGTAYGWIKISSPPARQTWRHYLPEGLGDQPKNYVGYDSRQPGGSMTPEDCSELGRLLGLDSPAHCQGESVPASYAYRQEYVDRAEGRKPSKTGQPYWD